MIKEYNDSYYDTLNFCIYDFDVRYLKVSNPYLVNYIYVDNDKPIGLISYSVIYDRIELEYLWVREDFRNKGIGSLLIDHMFKTDDVINVTLEVCVENYSAISLYKKKGFKVVAIRKNYYNGKDAYLMVREMM